MRALFILPHLLCDGMEHDLHFDHNELFLSLAINMVCLQHPISLSLLKLGICARLRVACSECVTAGMLQLWFSSSQYEGTRSPTSLKIFSGEDCDASAQENIWMAIQQQYCFVQNIVYKKSQNSLVI